MSSYHVLKLACRSQQLITQIMRFSYFLAVHGHTLYNTNICRFLFVTVHGNTFWNTTLVRFICRRERPDTLNKQIQSICRRKLPTDFLNYGYPIISPSEQQHIWNLWFWNHASPWAARHLVNLMNLHFTGLGIEHVGLMDSEYGAGVRVQQPPRKQGPLGSASSQIVNKLHQTQFLTCESKNYSQILVPFGASGQQQM